MSQYNQAGFIPKKGHDEAFVDTLIPFLSSQPPMNRVSTSAGAVPESIPKSNILGVPFFSGDLMQAADLLCSVVEKDLRCQACVLATNNAVWAAENARLMAIYRQAFLCLADGVPLLWASRLLSRSIKGRSSGHDVLAELCKAAARFGWSCFFLGGFVGVVESAARNLEVRYPGLDVAGTLTPPFKEQFTSLEIQEMADQVNQSGAKILFVSMSSPKQDLWIAKALPYLQVNIAIGIGAALDVAAGRFKRPPAWIRDNGLEWAYRLIQEPSRLFRRYVIEAPRFIPYLIKQIFDERLQNN